jgi:CHASE3 domain sensor protein
VAVSSLNRSDGTTPPVVRRKPSVLDSLRNRLFTTPGRLGGLLIAVVVVCALASGVASAALAARSAAVLRVRDNAAPVVIATQRLSSSLAEADAAATAAFLSGIPEDKSQRQDFELSLARVAASVEQAARLIGNNPDGHAALASINTKVVTYAGLVEVARTQRRAGDTNAAASLSTASRYLRNDISPELSRLADDAKKRLTSESGKASQGELLVLAMLLLAALAVALTQIFVYLKTKRLVNVGLFLATLVLLSVFFWAFVGMMRQANDLDASQATSGQSVELLAKVRTSAYGYATGINQALIVGAVPSDTAGRSALAVQRITAADIAASRTGPIVLGGLLGDVNAASADPTRRALTSEMLARWQRFADVSDRIVAEVDPAARSTIASNESNAAFAGFNVTVDAVLAKDEATFLSGIDGAHHRLKNLSLALLIAPILAAALAFLGLQRRMGEYR